MHGCKAITGMTSLPLWARIFMGGRGHNLAGASIDTAKHGQNSPNDKSGLRTYERVLRDLRFAPNVIAVCTGLYLVYR